MSHKDDWQAWHEERVRFKARETEGFTKDMDALKAHILTLLEVVPKDKAGWPVGQALAPLTYLVRERDRATKCLQSVS